jgi:hypothetical protein
VRVTALSAILAELQEHMHEHLTSSLLACKVFVLPFHRDVELDCAKVAAMHSTLSYCQKSGGVLIVAQEHRLSLHLKHTELHAQGEFAICAALVQLFSIPTRELLDESDAILSHKYQLIYAHGSAMPLPNGRLRWQTLQAILQAINASELVKSLLEPIAILGKTFHEGFQPCRLLCMDDAAEHCESIYRAIMDHLLDHPPFELSWLRGYSNRREEFYPFVTKPETADLDPNTPLDHRAAFLALRGFLACGVLLYTLTKRHNVEYGINRTKTAKKRLAVPYRSSHTPTERSEYGHPDCAIAYTALSYYYDGLSHAEFHEALVKLVEYKAAAQNYFGQWFERSRPRMEDPGADWQSIEHINQLDVHNQSQMTLCVTCRIPDHPSSTDRNRPAMLILIRSSMSLAGCTNISGSTNIRLTSGSTIVSLSERRSSSPKSSLQTLGTQWKALDTSPPLRKFPRPSRFLALLQNP